MGEEGQEDLGDKGTFGQSQDGGQVLCCFSFVRSTGVFCPDFLSSGLSFRGIACLIIISVSFYLVESMFPAGCTV